jgi:hypothetical protein
MQVKKKQFRQFIQFIFSINSGTDHRAGGGGVANHEQRSSSRSRRGGVPENQIAVATAARLFFLTAVAIAIATRPFKFHEISVSNTSSSFDSSIHSFVCNHWALQDSTVSFHDPHVYTVSLHLQLILTLMRIRFLLLISLWTFVGHMYVVWILFTTKAALIYKTSYFKRGIGALNGEFLFVYVHEHVFKMTVKQDTSRQTAQTRRAVIRSKTLVEDEFR